MNLWDKGVTPHKAIIEFTSDADREFDSKLTGWDIAGSMAHAVMLFRTGLLEEKELHSLVSGLNLLYEKNLKGELTLSPGTEDIHTLIEEELTKSSGQAGRKVHTGRSRNDQVLTDLRLFIRHETDLIAAGISSLCTVLADLSEKHSGVMIPGYTHLQPAMVSTFGLWFGSYAEALTDDLVLLEASRKLNNRSPLGTAAGYGTTLPVDRDLTATLLGFEGIILNSAYASINRGKAEAATLSALGSVASTLAKLAADICLFMTAEFSFINFPDEYITGSSIMPQKRNPDVFEIIRARCNSVIAAQNTVRVVLSNLQSGYHRDLQELKGPVMKSFKDISECLAMTELMMGGIRVNKEILEGDFYDHIFSTEEVYRLVRKGTPFRDAYRIVAGKLAEGNFPRTKTADYTHRGSVGNLCNSDIQNRMQLLMRSFSSPSEGELIASIVKAAGEC
jgi:argininosuccinate lyase